MADTGSKREADSAGSDELSQRVKRVKTDSENGAGDVKERESENILSEFTTTSVLSDSAREKNIFIHGKVSCLS